MVELSAVIISYNEEDNIGDCIDSLAGIVEEIVVVDSFSQDRTEEICREKGVKFVQHEFEGHIEQKNYAITRASNRYVLSLDADERLSEELKTSILQVKKNWTHDGYFVNRLNNYCGKWIRHGAWYPDKKLRLWDSSKGKWTGVNPHDRFELAKGSSTSRLQGDLLHYSFRSVEEHKKQIEYFSTIKAQIAFQKGERFALVKMLVKPVFKFIRNYFFKLGILDGFYGLIIARNSFEAEIKRYQKLIKLRKESAE